MIIIQADLADHSSDGNSQVGKGDLPPPALITLTLAGDERYGQFATSRLEESRLLAIREISDVLRCPRLVGSLLSLVLKMRFPPSVVESKHGWRTAMHLEGRNEVENRNEACVMEVASLGSRAKMRAKEAENKERDSAGR